MTSTPWALSPNRHRELLVFGLMRLPLNAPSPPRFRRYGPGRVRAPLVAFTPWDQLKDGLGGVRLVHGVESHPPTSAAVLAVVEALAFRVLGRRFPVLVFPVPIAALRLAGLFQPLGRLAAVCLGRRSAVGVVF